MITNSLRSATNRRTAMSALADAAIRPPKSAGCSIAWAKRSFEPARQQAQECLLEGSVENSVNDGVDDAGRVTQPEKPLVEQFFEVTRWTESHGEVH